MHMHQHEDTLYDLYLLTCMYPFPLCLIVHLHVREDVGICECACVLLDPTSPRFHSAGPIFQF